MDSQVTYDWEGLRALCRRLRAPGGCDWDRAQTLETLTPYLLEETHEVLEAIGTGENVRTVEELGDLLFLITFLITIAEEEERFTLAEVLTGIMKKMIRRHPHIFGEAPRSMDFDAAREQWETIKKREKGRGDRLASGAETLPALIAAYRVQEKAASFGFDWPEIGPVLEKLKEETAELRHALATRATDRAACEEEVGDVLFTVVNLARHLNSDPEQLLKAATRKFRRRFARMEAHLQAQEIALTAADLDTMEAAWQAVKRAEQDD